MYSIFGYQWNKVSNFAWIINVSFMAMGGGLQIAAKSLGKAIQKLGKKKLEDALKRTVSAKLKKYMGYQKALKWSGYISGGIGVALTLLSSTIGDAIALAIDYYADPKLGYKRKGYVFE
ncbi:hypothetical protein ACFVSW_17895 [Neobacillus sp. NPDC058068]|uniref:hypothetical protein n=1 Tax=Neobacillus sp. NPDC058068 TaxID=3346325 RepID=UPI0036D7CEE6